MLFSNQATMPWPSLPSVSVSPTLSLHPSKLQHFSKLSASSSSQPNTSAGNTKRLVLSPDGRDKLNPSPDRDFYSFPRFVTHVDDSFISTLTNLYRERLKPDYEILDLMSSWVSHLPPEVKYKRVVGHGLNAQELARNSRLDYFFVKDLNQDQDQKLEFEDESFDAVLCTVSVQYLQWPEKVSNDLYFSMDFFSFCFRKIRITMLDPQYANKTVLGISSNNISATCFHALHYS
jgi:hypothetical protein